jgi:hypothetical protein
MLESDDIIAKFAKDYNIEVSNMKAFNFIFAVEKDKNTMLKSHLKVRCDENCMGLCWCCWWCWCCFSIYDSWHVQYFAVLLLLSSVTL